MSIAKKGEKIKRKLRDMLPKPEYERLIEGKPKPKKTSGRNTGKSTYRKS